MCGICGLWYFDPSHHVNPALLHAMTDSIQHRGPDEDGFHIESALGLGFRRLSIIDVGGSHQPMANEDSSAWIVFNGEIYNFQALRAKLTTRHSFRTIGDTETILHLHEDMGAACVNELRGMFALAIWDNRLKQLTLAVDRFGKKPLYYFLDGEKLIFGSELKVILQHPAISREIDAEAFDEYLAYGYVNAPRSIYRAIRKLAPGHTLIIDQTGQARLQSYWQPELCEPKTYDTRSITDLSAELRELLLDSVKLRMISDVPLGAFLSGGIDSSAIVGLMSHLSTQPVKTFSIGFDEAVYDETAYAQIVADYCHTDHVRTVVRPDVINILPKLIHQFDEPFADSSMIPTYYVAQVARQHVTVALSGDGGDEVFGGYSWYQYGARHHALERLIPASLRPGMARIGGQLPRFTKVGAYLKRVDQPISYWQTRTGFFDARMRGRLYTADAAKILGACPGEQRKLEAFRHTASLDWLSQFQYNDLTVYMAGDILVKVDRASMLASLEVRSPLLDHVVFEFMARVPPQFKLTLGDTKILLKKAVGDLLPPAIHRRGKQGFSIPLGEWLAGPLRDMLHDALLSPRTAARGLFQQATMAQLVEEHNAGQADHSERLWSLLCFELWARDYLDA